MATQPQTQTFETREDLGMRFDEFDLAMNRLGFIAHLVMPIVQRSEPNGKFPRVPIEQLLQNLDTKRNLDGTYKRSTREWKDDNYETEEHGLEATLDDRTQKRYDDIVDAEVFEGEVIEDALLMAYERAVASNVFNTSTFTGRTSALTTPWSDVASSTPVADIRARRQTIRKACGVKPNALVINDEVFDNLINNTNIIDNLKYQGFQDARPGEISRQALAISLNIDEVIVAEGLYNTVEPGDETVDAVLDDIWGNGFALFARIAKTNNPMERCIGRTVQWDEEGGMAGDRMSIIAETYYEENRRGGVLRRRTDWGLKNLFLECGWLFTNVT